MELDLIMFMILALVIMFACTAFGVLLYSGLFSFPSVQIGEPPIKNSCIFAYQFLRGPYSSNDVGGAFTLTTSIAPRAPCIGIYYDDPQVVRPDELRCAIGCLITEDDLPEEGNVDNAKSTRIIDDDAEELLKLKSFKFHRLPQIDQAVLTEFPYTTPFSIWLAPNRVYPRIADFVSSRGVCAYPMIELYADNLIKYIAPLSKQDDFFVPETAEYPPTKRRLSGDGEGTDDVPLISTQAAELLRSEEGELRRRRRPSSSSDEDNREKSDNEASPPTTLSSFSALNSAEEKPEDEQNVARKGSSSSSSFEELGADELGQESAAK